MSRTSRRDLLKLSCGTGIVAVAGCLDSDDERERVDDSGDDNDEPEDDGELDDTADNGTVGGPTEPAPNILFEDEMVTDSEGDVEATVIVITAGDSDAPAELLEIEGVTAQGMAETTWEVAADELAAGNSITIGRDGTELEDGTTPDFEIAADEVRFVWDNTDILAEFDLSELHGQDEAVPPGNGTDDEAVVEEWLDSEGAEGWDGTIEDLTGQAEVVIEHGANAPDYAFDPPAARVEVGTTVIFEWVSGGHTIHEEESTTDFDSETAIEDEGYTHDVTFTEPGLVLYYCQPHRGQGHVGGLIVE